jgi:membrane-associated protease RseP (regulator of RpoE activity)
MGETLGWMAVGVAVWTAAVVIGDRYGVVPERVRVRGPFLSVRIERTPRSVRRLAAAGRFWRVWATAGVALSLVAMGLLLLSLVVVTGLRTVHPELAGASGDVGPSSLLAASSGLPLWAVLIALVTTVVVHELGHAVVCLVEGIELDAVGVSAVAFVPLGLFVSPNREGRTRAPVLARLRLFAVGVANNVALGVGAVFVLFALAGTVAPVAGVPVVAVEAGSPADGHLEAGDVVTGANGREVRTPEQLSAVLSATHDGRARLSLASGATVTVDGPANEDAAALGIRVHSGSTILTPPPGARLRDRIGALVFAPVAAMTVPGSDAGFLGVTGPLTDGYTVKGPLADFESAVFALVTLAFWLAWFNLVVGLSNLLPVVTLDGGHLLRTVTRVGAERVGASDPELVAAVGTLAVSGATVLCVLFLVLG